MFVTFCFVDVFLTLTNSSILCVSRILCTLTLLFYYSFSVTKNNYIFLAMLLFFTISDGLFCEDKASVLGFVTIIIARALLLNLVLKESWKIDKRLLIISSSMLLVFAIFIFTIFNIGNIQFYLSMIIALLLIVLFSVLFNKLLISKEKGVEEWFLAVTIFIITDVVFSMNDMSFLGDFRYVIVLGAYHLSYYLLCKGMIRKQT